MISLARTGPVSMKIVLSSGYAEIRRILCAWGTQVPIDAENALGKYGPTHRLVFLEAHDAEISETYVSETPREYLLAEIINKGMAAYIENTAIMPGFITVRLMGDVMRGIKAIQRDIGGDIIDRAPMFRPDIPGTSSIVYFTQYPLSKSVPAEALYEKALLIHTRSKGALMQHFSVRGIEYLSDSLGTPDWNDFEIKICDSDGFFDLHRQRLLTVTQGTQIGIVLEEKWETEQALTRRRIPVYMMKLFTPLGASMIKKFAMGLEYNAQGQRFADFDVYHNRRKISAFTQLEKNPGKTRNDIGMYCRDKILKNVDMESLTALINLEAEIERRRKLPPKTDKK